MKREPSLAGAFLIAAWFVADAWLIYGAVQHLIWRVT